MRTIRFLFVVIVSSFSGNVLSAQQLPAAEKVNREAWTRTMTRTPHPRPQGCFTGTYPRTEWQEVPCTTAPNRPYPPAKFPPAVWPTPHVVGNGTDFSAQVTGSLSSAVGSFDQVNDVTSETDSASGSANTYSLQLNTSFMAGSPACSGASVPANCRSWQQFIYTTTFAQAFMQYWLINYVNTCPGGWTTYLTHCYRNSTGVVVPAQPLSNLANLSVTGTATNGGNDTVTLSTSVNAYSTSGNDNVISLATGWTNAEYNVFGDGNGSQANFNANSNIIVRTSVNNGTMNVPTVLTQGYMGETNNYTLVPPACPYGNYIPTGAGPAIVFDESNRLNPWSMCANGTSIGDTHLTNVNGLLYDFQASGDFLLAQTDVDFVVQTRQVSGAPTWPNASVNKAVAMKMGATRVAVCLAPNRLVIDGKPRDLANGASLSLPGVFITRNGNTYVFTRPSGESVQTDLNNGWINANVSLGRIPVAWVHGLLGNVNGNTGPDDLASRAGTVLAQPVSFNDLYSRYGDSWRVPGAESLPAQLCGKKVDRGNPKKPFFANDLKPADSRRAREICIAAQVREGALLDACTLDVAVLGDKAAAEAFARANPPRAVVQLGPPGKR